MIRARRWVATINLMETIDRLGFNGERSEMVWGASLCWEELKEMVVNNDIDIRYFGGELEHLDEGNIHIQAYMEFNKQYRMTRIKNMNSYFQMAHLEMAMGSFEDNQRYIQKEDNGTFWEWHEPDYILPEQRPKNQWDLERGIPGMIEHGATFNEIFRVYPQTALQYECGIKKRIAERNQRDHKTWDGNLQQKNLWIWGPRGSGKTKAAFEGYGGPIYNKALNKWWDGYEEEYKVVLLDDWDPTHKVLASHLKKWGDRYPFIAEVKNGSAAVNPGNYRLIVTSNYSIEECFENQQDIEAIRRRFHVIHMTELRERE